MTDDRHDREAARAERPRPAMGGGASPVYGLGMIGALVYYWSRADDGRGRAAAVGRSLVWPAFVVHDLLRHLER